MNYCRLSTCTDVEGQLPMPTTVASSHEQLWLRRILSQPVAPRLSFSKMTCMQKAIAILVESAPPLPWCFLQDRPLAHPRRHLRRGAGWHHGVQSSSIFFLSDFGTFLVDSEPLSSPGSPNLCLGHSQLPIYPINLNCRRCLLVGNYGN